MLKNINIFGQNTILRITYMITGAARFALYVAG